MMTSVDAAVTYAPGCCASASASRKLTRVSASLRNRAQAKASLQPCMHSILEAKVQEPTLLHQMTAGSF
jgi:hypothetical protein